MSVSRSAWVQGSALSLSHYVGWERVSVLSYSDYKSLDLNPRHHLDKKPACPDVTGNKSACCRVVFRYIASCAEEQEGNEEND